MTSRLCRVVGLMWVVGAWAPCVLAEDPGVQIQLEPGDMVGMDELALLRIKIDGGDQKASVPDFKLENFEIVAGPSQSTSLTIYNGVPNSSVTYSWHLKPLKVGKGRVYDARLRVEGRVRQLDERQVEIVEQAPLRDRRRASNDPLDSIFSDPFFNRSRLRGRRNRQEPARRPPPEIFLEAVVSPARPWVGQQVLYTLYLYTQTGIRSINPSDLPSFKGFWALEVPQPEQLVPQSVERDGKNFGRVVLLQRALFPRRAGAHTIDSAEVQLLATVTDRRPFSLMPRSQELTRTSNPVQLDVRELPSAPAGFSGIVGRVDLEANLTPLQLEVGDAATLTLTLDGEGHLQGVTAPELPDLPEIEIFPPQQQSEESLRRKKVTGKRTWSFVLVPQKPGTWELPSIEIPYFDPKKERYEIARTEGFELQVSGSTSLIQDSGRTVDLHSIRTAALPTIESPGLSLTAAGPWLFLLPWVLALVLLRTRRSSGRGSGGDHKALIQRIGAASKEERPRQVAASIEEAWRDFLVARWEIPQGTPSTRWSHFLEENGAPKSASADLVQLADDLHYLRYAPKLSSTEELQRELVARSRKLAKALR